jgi:hypothetical protein
MKRIPTIEQRLMAAGQGRGTNERFIQRTMQAIEKEVSGRAFGKALVVERPRRRLFVRISHLPKAAIVALIVAACVLISGTAYAAYALWVRPTAQVRSTTQQYGRDQALIDLKNCYAPDQKVTVEITNGSGGTSQEAAQSLEAHCEIQAVQNWAIQRFRREPSNVLFPFVVAKNNGNTLTVENNETKEARTFTMVGNLPIAYQGKVIQRDEIKRNDTVALITSSDGKSLIALVKLTYGPSLYVSNRVFNSYHEREACIGNEDDSCINLPNIDILRDGEGGANPGAKGDMYEIQGKLADYSPAQFTLVSTSGKIFTVHTGSDVLGTFNTSNPYGPVTIEKGDVLLIMYRQPADGNRQDIQATQYNQIQLMLQGFDKSAAQVTNSQKYTY